MAGLFSKHFPHHYEAGAGKIPAKRAKSWMNYLGREANANSNTLKALWKLDGPVLVRQHLRREIVPQNNSPSPRRTRRGPGRGVEI
jgi:hypothetical protein